jgi:hypothetical protein
MVEITYQMVLSTLQTIALIVGIAYYLFIMRNSQRNQELARKAQEHATETRQLDIYMRYQMMGVNPDFNRNMFEVLALEWQNFDDFARRYSHTENPEGAGKRFAAFDYWNGLGYILSRGVIDSETAFDMFGNTAIGAWMKFEPIIQGFRERDGRPETWKWFEYFADEMKKVRERRGMPEYTMPWRPE